MAAAELRFEPKDDEKTPLDSSRLLEPRRIEDRGADLWTTFQPLQET